MKSLLQLSTLLLALASALPSHAGEAAPDFAQLNTLLYKGNRGDNAASLRAARTQMQAGNAVAALTRVAQTLRRGDVPARVQLVEWLAQGRLKALDAASAKNFVDEYTAGAAHGDAFGALMLGLFSEYGFGAVTPDAGQAIAHYKQATQGGSIWALTRLGLLYEAGHPPALAANLPLALFWYDQASGVDAEATAHVLALYRGKTTWAGHEPRTAADLNALEQRQREWDATHASLAVGP
ncbi:MAG TPA: hypothetical protein VGM81_22610 [Burkholderiaceae bacterium]|jgi:TPR repeat protein